MSAVMTVITVESSELPTMVKSKVAVTAVMVTHWR